MDITSIIIALLGGTSIIGIFEAWRQRKANDKIKSCEAQSHQIDLGSKLIEEALEMFDKVQHSMDSYRETMDANHKEVMDRFDNIEKRLSDVEEYLNGDFKA